MATSDMIAHNVNTHPSRVRKVMSCLRKQGYIVTKEGIGGGYMLNCNPEDVSLAEIYRATSIGSMKPSWCSGKEDMECMVACNMAEVMEHIFCDAEQQLLTYLEQTKISGVLERVRATQLQKQ
jgi:DNA-binding IscR family transcriptional regulator